MYNRNYNGFAFPFHFGVTLDGYIKISNAPKMARTGINGKIAEHSGERPRFGNKTTIKQSGKQVLGNHYFLNFRSTFSDGTQF